MAASDFTLLNIAKKKIADGTFDLDGHTFKMALTTSSQSIDATFAGTSGDARYSDLTNEASSGSGYTTGGQTLSGVTWNRSAGTVSFAASPVTWTALTKTFKYAVLYDDTATNKDILGFIDLNTVGSVTVSGTSYIITWPDSFIFTLS